MKNRKKEKQPKNVLQKITSALEVPEEIVQNVPFITITGSGTFEVENYKGIIEYSTDKLRINTPSGVVSVIGKSLTLSRITSESLRVDGKIRSIEFLR
jgi:sporulation protein YqfC